MTDIDFMTTQEILQALLRRGVTGVISVEQPRDDHEDGKQCYCLTAGHPPAVAALLVGVTVQSVIRHYADPEARRRAAQVITSQVIHDIEDRIDEPYTAPKDFT